MDTSGLVRPKAAGGRPRSECPGTKSSPACRRASGRLIINHDGDF